MSFNALRIVPATTHENSFSHIPSRTAGAPSAPGLHDTLRAGVGPSPLTTGADKPTSAHPLEARLKAWESTREALRMETLRRAYGVAEPVRRQMELKIAREGQWKPMALGGGSVGGMGSVHEDILAGRDDTIAWEDVFTGEEGRASVGVHEEMERKLKM
ncbi:proteasome maturation factor UMP1-domain-containing protein [Chaetomium tenue]|uniref:Proteasome maturation factor UMP1-domain-containing protein n=1 Tax=Chaetomium tenue TaxID=1854479 RepID=A0ACB7P909_9PEZI|nr:proteasome maturation factor UMP1-domain-containing protein [Chaetomium globosum]